MKSCSCCGHQSANEAGYCQACLSRFSGREARTNQKPEEGAGPALAGGFVLLMAILIVSAAGFLALHSHWWEVFAQLLAKALRS